MSVSLALVLAIGAPLILLSLGFFLLSLKMARSKIAEANAEDFIFLAKALELRIKDLENRIKALEDILMFMGGESKGKTYNQ
jgi:hypothetical protein